jgi:cytochrome P450 PksS
MTQVQQDVPMLDPSMIGPDFPRNPFPVYRHMQQTAPVWKMWHPDGFPLYIMTRYDDIKESMSNGWFSQDFNTLDDSSALKPPKNDPMAPLMEALLNTDPPKHTRLRKLVTTAFSAKRVEPLRDHVATHAAELIDVIAPRGEADLVTDYVNPLPGAVVSKLFDIPEDDWADFRKRGEFLMTPPFGTTLADIQVVKLPMYHYTVDLVDRKRRNPGDDIISALVQARDGADKLTENELIGMTFQLLMTAYQTTIGLLANSFVALLSNRDQLELLQTRPELMDTALEELLRYAGPIESAPIRFAATDIDVRGTLIPKGSPVSVVILAANRDPSVFDEPDRLDLARSPNPHLAFGAGTHFCLGTILARMEASLAISALITRLPDVRLAVPEEQLPYRPGVLLHAPSSVPVVFTPPSP